jgi:UrcA family protein
MTINSNAGRKTVGLTIAFGLTFAMMTALNAQDTVVEGRSQSQDIVEERVGFADLDLRDSGHQQMLVSRVRQASRNVCNIVYEDRPMAEKFYARCPQRSFRAARPQIDVAIANALNGRKVAMNFVVSAGR